MNRYQSKFELTDSDICKEYFVNVYQDSEGYFISNGQYDSYESAYESRDKLSTYHRTVKIVEYKNK